MTTYIIKTILCSGILLMVYHLFLQKEKMHRFNRFYLLISIVFSLAIPLVSVEIKPDSIPVAIPEYVQTTQIFNDIPEKSFPGKSQIAVAESGGNWPKYVPTGIYILIVLLLLVRMARNLRIIYIKKNKGQTVPYHGANLVLLPQSTVTFTFLDHIFIGEADFKQGRIEDEVLTHELAHVQQKHSLDVLFVEMIQALFWFNPILFFYKKAIQLNHEFLADDAVLLEHHNVSSYQLLLLDKILYTRQINLTSSFNYSITKQRLAMMTTNSNKTVQFLKKVAIPLLTACLVFTFCEKIYSQEKEQTQVKKAQPITKPTKIEASGNSTTIKRPRALYEQKSGTGLSEDESREFIETIEKHTKYVKNKKGRTDLIVEMPPALENQMFELYTRMTKDQQMQQYDSGLTMFQMDIPVKKAPTPEMFENWKKPTIFGIWINNKHVPNSELNKYKYSDIAEYDLSKLYGAALKGRIYKYQLNLLTNDFFDKTYDARVADRIMIARGGFFKAP